MAIKRTTAYEASDGTVHGSVEEAQQHEVAKLVNSLEWEESAQTFYPNIATLILRNRDTLLDILTTGPRSRPAARKKAGTTAPRRAVKAGSEAAKAGFAAARKAVDNPADNATHDAVVSAAS